jgi:hypothetical protein
VALSNGNFVLVLTVGAALLALWIDVRLPKLAPASLKRVILHVAVALVGLHLIPGIAATVTLYLALFAVVLPALVYTFLTALWFIRIAQRTLASGLR